MDAAPPKLPWPGAAARRHLLLIHPGCLSKQGWNIHPRARKRPLRSHSGQAKGGTCGAQHCGMLSTSRAGSAPRELHSRARAGVPIAAPSWEPAFGKRKGGTACQAASGLLRPAAREGRRALEREKKKKREKKRGAIFVSWSSFSPTQLTPLVRALSYQIGAAAGRAMPKERLEASGAPAGREGMERIKRRGRDKKEAKGKGEERKGKGKKKKEGKGKKGHGLTWEGRGKCVGCGRNA